MKFILNSDFQPAGDQPKAITDLCNGLNKKKNDQDPLEATGSG